MRITNIVHCHPPRQSVRIVLTTVSLSWRLFTFLNFGSHRHPSSHQFDSSSSLSPLSKSNAMSAQSTCSLFQTNLWIFCFLFFPCHILFLICLFDLKWLLCTTSLHMFFILFTICLFHLNEQNKAHMQRSRAEQSLFGGQEKREALYLEVFIWLFWYTYCTACTCRKRSITTTIYNSPPLILRHQRIILLVCWVWRRSWRGLSKSDSKLR